MIVGQAGGAGAFTCQPKLAGAAARRAPSYNSFMRFGRAIFALAFVTAGFADTLTLRNGKVVKGTYMGGTARTIKMDLGDTVRTYDVTDVASLQFTAAAPVAAPAATLEIPAGTAFTVRLIDSLESETNGAGRTYRATLDEPVVIAGETVIQRGSAAIVKLTARALDLVAVKVNGRMVDLHASIATPAQDAQASVKDRLIFMADRRVRI